MRTVFLDFTGQVSGDGLRPGNGAYDIDLRIGEEFINGEWTGKKLDIVEMDGGTTSYGALSINFAPAGEGRPSKLLYRMVFGSLASGWPVCNDRYPMKVYRGGSKKAPLNSWTISATAEDRACLWKLHKQLSKAEQIGYFSMPFSIDVEEIPVVEQP